MSGVGVSARDRARARAFALLTGLVCLLGQLGAVVHLGVVRHVRCAEHDALVHAERPGAEAAPVEGAAALPVEAAEHADEHCLVAELRRTEWQGPTATSTAAPAPTAPDVPALDREVAPAAPVDLLRLAPKSSPPTARG